MMTNYVLVGICFLLLLVISYLSRRLRKLRQRYKRLYGLFLEQKRRYNKLKGEAPLLRKSMFEMLSNNVDLENKVEQQKAEIQSLQKLLND